MNYKDLLIIGKLETVMTIKSKRALKKYQNEIFAKQLTEIRKDKLAIVDRIISFRESIFEVDEKYHNFLNEILKIYYLGYNHSVIIAIGAIAEELSKLLLNGKEIIINKKKMTKKEKQNLSNRLNQSQLIDFLFMASIIDNKTKGNLHEIRTSRNKCMHDFDKVQDVGKISKKIIKLFLTFLGEHFKPQKKEEVQK